MFEYHIQGWPIDGLNLFLPAISELLNSLSVSRILLF